MQPRLELGIVHVRRPAESRRGFPIARHGERFGVGQVFGVVPAPARIEISKRIELIRRKRPDVDHVTGLAVAHLDTDRIRHHQMREALGRFHRDLRRDPGAEPDADGQNVSQVELLQEIKIEVG